MVEPSLRLHPSPLFGGGLTSLYIHSHYNTALNTWVIYQSFPSPLSLYTARQIAWLGRGPCSCASWLSNPTAMRISPLAPSRTRGRFLQPLVGSGGGKEGVSSFSGDERLVKEVGVPHRASPQQSRVANSARSKGFTYVHRPNGAAGVGLRSTFPRMADSVLKVCRDICNLRCIRFVPGKKKNPGSAPHPTSWF